MSTKSKNITTKNNTSDNKVTFAPLGKHAIIAVIMASTIVTTAIMLNKQLGTVEEQIAVIENEVAKTNAGIADTTVTAENSEATETIAAKSTIDESIETTEVIPVEIQAAEAPPGEATETIAAKSTIEETIEIAEVRSVEAPSAEVLIEKELSTAETAVVSSNDTQQTNSAASTKVELATSEAPAQAPQSQAPQSQVVAQVTRASWDEERQARLDTFKLEQKQRMTEMFDRIKTLETQQLDQYKASQDKQVEHLREQIAQQQELIETLVLRNEEWLEMRKASVQRHQSNREKMLNRI